ncbi:hypothetical protein PHYPO_G00004940 [Pangasianodon hypophthalmus]|uniref:Uncharacterized protein n=1 Tax=Pangasianodon hypophthalmus TaxID=310915 RepID=A0A5N5Q487_PANHP|nr:hypothetical protein PHYPO_G00004940 [Pangasianodon hypophthalmus]
MQLGHQATKSFHSLGYLSCDVSRKVATEVGRGREREEGNGKRTGEPRHLTSTTAATSRQNITILHSQQK